MLRFTIFLAASISVVMGIAPTPVAGATCAPNDTLCLQLQDAKQTQANANLKLQDIQQSLEKTFCVTYGDFETESGDHQIEPLFRVTA